MLNKLTLSRLVTAITFIAIFVMAARESADMDTWWHLRTGQWIVEHRAVPRVDPFSHTRLGASWESPGWLAQVAMYGLFSHFGFAGLNLFTASFVTLAFVWVYRACEGHALLKAFTLVLAAVSSGVYWSARPQIISFMLSGLFAYVLWLYRWRGTNRLWVLPPLMALWANVHGGFAIGFILLAINLVGQGLTWAYRWFCRKVVDVPVAQAVGDLDARGLRWLAGTGLACGVAVVVNPAGPVMLLYPLKTVAMAVLQESIQEWQSPNFHLFLMHPFLVLLVATLAAMAWSRLGVNLTDWVLVCGVAYLGLLAGRHMALLALVAPPVLTRQVQMGWADLKAREPRWGQWVRLSSEAPHGRMLMFNWLVLGMVTLAGLVKVALVLPTATNEVKLAKMVPVAAAAFVKRTHPVGKLFNSYNYGAYLLWALYPDYPVYVDGRTDLYSDLFLREYIAVITGRKGYEATLDKYGVNVVLVEANALLSDRLRENPHWRQTYADPVAVVYEREQKP